MPLPACVPSCAMAAVAVRSHMPIALAVLTCPPPPRLNASARCGCYHDTLSHIADCAGCADMPLPACVPLCAAVAVTVRSHIADCAGCADLPPANVSLHTAVAVAVRSHIADCTGCVDLPPPSRSAATVCHGPSLRPSTMPLPTQLHNCPLHTPTKTVAPSTPCLPITSTSHATFIIQAEEQQKAGKAHPHTVCLTHTDRVIKGTLSITLATSQGKLLHPSPRGNTAAGQQQAYQRRT